MAKKKKNKNKNAQNSSSKTPSSGQGRRQVSSQEIEEETNPTQYSAIVVCLPSDSAKKANRPLTEENARIVQVHENDARGFGVKNGEEILILQVDLSDDRGLLSKNENSGPWSPPSAKIKWTEKTEFVQPSFASICRIAVLSNSFTSPSKSGGGPSKKNNITREGEAKILPSSLMEKVTDDAISSGLKHSPQTPSASMASTGKITPVPSSQPMQAPSPSPSTPNFTFQSFVSSPASKIKPSSIEITPQSERKSKRKKYMALLSLEKSEEVYRLLTADAEHLTLALFDSTSFFSKDVLKKSEQILGRLAKALCRDIYFSVNDIIMLSFQGKRLQFVVKDAKHHVDKEFDPHVYDISSSLGDMNIRDKAGVCQKNSDSSNGLMKEIIRQLKGNVSKPMLFRVNYQTKFTFQFEDTEEESSKQGTTTEVTGVLDRKIPQRRMVAGLNAIEKQIHSLLIPTLFHPERFPRGGSVRAPKGVLLHGTSGCGKSLLAQQITRDIKNFMVQGSEKTKRVVETVHVNCARIQSSTSIMGDAERKLTKIFERAERQAVRENISTLLLLDDIHLICPRRGAAGEGSGVERVASTLLALMDGIGKDEGGEHEHKIANYGNVAILAITTNPSLLDPALRRAGRLDTEVEVPSPDDKAKCEIFSLCLENLKLDGINVPCLSDSEVMSLSRLAKGFTGADCKLGIKEAVRGAITRHRTQNMQNSSIELNSADIESAIRRTKPSSIKSITVEIPRVPWSSIGGMDSVKRSLREAIELPLTHSHLFTALRIPPPRGVLLYGPPGCSKTLMARALATEGNMNFLTVKGPELLSKWLGESERALAALFRRARLASPCVIFFDEVDAIASKRGSGESSGGERMLSQLLTELDGVTNTAVGSDKKQPRVVVVGATNRPDLLDSALTRPGRIDRMIYVGVPDKNTRRAIFDLQLKGKACEPNLDTSKLALESEGFSGAEIVSICRESALFAIEESDETPSERPLIKMRHLLRAMGGTKKQITAEMLHFYESYGKSATASQ